MLAELAIRHVSEVHRDYGDLCGGFEAATEGLEPGVCLDGCKFARMLFRIGRDIDPDFRLIRRSAIGGIRIVSTIGTCVELVRNLKLNGQPLHGMPQFLRLKWLFSTLQQLVLLWLRFGRDR